MATGPWQLTGNAGTDPGTNFLGTTDGEPLSIKAAEISLDLTNGGGQLHVTNNPGDNRIWMEAFNNAGDGSATELLLTGQDGQNVPVLSLFADQLSVRSKEMIFSLQPNGGGRLRIASNTNDNKVWLEAYDATGNTSATEFLLTGAFGSNVPQMTFNAANATFTGNLSGPTISQLVSAIESLQSAVNQLQLEINQLAATAG